MRFPRASCFSEGWSQDLERRSLKVAEDGGCRDCKASREKEIRLSDWPRLCWQKDLTENWALIRWGMFGVVNASQGITSEPRNYLASRA